MNKAEAEMVEAVGPIMTSARGLGYAYAPGEAGTLVFAHGFMDGPASWSPLLGSMSTAGWGAVVADQTTLNAADIGEGNLLAYYADEIVALVRELDLPSKGPVVVLGQSMGGQIAELVARGLGDDVSGLAMFCPAPLKGYR